MKRILWAALLLLLSSAFGWATDDVVSAVHGTVTKMDAGTKTAVVKTKDGTEDTFHGLKEGSDVVAHYTVKGTDKTAVEIDNVGKHGIKAVDGTVTHIDRGTKTVAVKTADGTEQTFKLSGHAAADAGKDIGKGTEKSAKVTVYYTEKAGKKTAHFFEKI